MVSPGITDKWARAPPLVAWNLEQGTTFAQTPQEDLSIRRVWFPKTP